MKMTIILILIRAFSTVTIGLLKGQEDLGVGGRVETIQTAALLRKASILTKVLRLEETCYHLHFSQRSSANADVKKSQGVNNDNNKEDLPSSKTALSHPYNDSKTTLKNTKED